MEVDDNNDDDYDVDNIGLSFEELKQHHIKQVLQQCQDRNGPFAKTMIDMTENPPSPFELSDDDEMTDDVLIGKKGKDTDDNDNRMGNTGKIAKCENEIKPERE